MGFFFYFHLVLCLCIFIDASKRVVCLTVATVCGRLETMLEFLAAAGQAPVLLHRELGCGHHGLLSSLFFYAASCTFVGIMR